MPTDLHHAPANAVTGLDAPVLEALRRLALECAVQVDAATVAEVLRRSAESLYAADAVEVSGAMLDPPPGPLAAFCLRAQREERPVLAGPDCAEPAPAELRRAVAMPLRIRGEPGAVAVGWSEDPGGERALALARALAEQAAVGLSAATRYAELRDVAFRRDRFFSAMSHDLRTPITAIVGYSELLQDGIVGPLSERQQEMVERICQVSAELSQLVTDMLDLAKLDAGRMEFHREPMSLSAVLEVGLEGAEAQLEATGSSVQMGPVAEGDAPLRVDRPRVRQVLGNLLSHAAHAAPGGVVRVSAASDPGGMWIEVVDAGPPMPAGTEESLFEALPRAGAQTARVGPGAALSLALSRRMARAMGGEVEARAHPQGGLSLTLRLPPRVA